MKKLGLVLAFGLVVGFFGSVHALPPGGGGGGEGGGDWCVSCQDCCDGFTFANGANNCHAQESSDGTCLWCIAWGNCRIPVAIVVSAQ